MTCMRKYNKSLHTRKRPVSVNMRHPPRVQLTCECKHSRRNRKKHASCNDPVVTAEFSVTPRQRRAHSNDEFTEASKVREYHKKPESDTASPEVLIGLYLATTTASRLRKLQYSILLARKWLSLVLAVATTTGKFILEQVFSTADNLFDAPAIESSNYLLDRNTRE
ncbi:hypothetical protein LZ30DRAFT_86411 [Colletotrichum cereale]|nr:hypothetical protein LZ30DRAFT_86411 [Colletotrichum cereale]